MENTLKQEYMVSSVETRLDIMTEEVANLEADLADAIRERDEAREIAQKIVNGWTVANWPDWLKPAANIWARYERR